MAVATSWHLVPCACFLAAFGFYARHNTLQGHATQMAPCARGTAAFSLRLQPISRAVSRRSGAVWLVDRYSAPAVFLAYAIGLLLSGLSLAVLVERRAHP